MSHISHNVFCLESHKPPLRSENPEGRTNKHRFIDWLLTECSLPHRLGASPTEGCLHKNRMLSRRRSFLMGDLINMRSTGQHMGGREQGDW